MVLGAPANRHVNTWCCEYRILACSNTVLGVPASGMLIQRMVLGVPAYRHVNIWCWEYQHIGMFKYGFGSTSKLVCHIWCWEYQHTGMLIQYMVLSTGLPVDVDKRDKDSYWPVVRNLTSQILHGQSIRKTE
jgi:hypothetical protein